MNDLGQAAVSADKAPRTERGRRTVRKLLEAAAQEFGQRGFHEAAITGITSRAGVVPIAHTQDTVGPHSRTVADAAITLSVIQSRTSDGRDPATGDVPLGWKGRARPTDIPTDYTQFLDADGLRGARLGVTRQGIDNAPAQVVAAFEETLDAMEAAGATLVDLDGAGFTFAPADGEFLVLCYEFRDDLRNYLATRRHVPLAGGTLNDAIAFNNANAEKEMPYFGQEIFELTAAMAQGPDDPQPTTPTVAAIMIEAERGYAVVNVNALDDSARFAGPGTPMVYDAEDEPARRARRRKLWTPAAIVGV